MRNAAEKGQEPWCCFIDDATVECTAVPRWEIWDRTSFDSVTHSCGKHVVDFLSATTVNEVRRL